MPAWNPAANALFLQALEIGTPLEREAFLRQACGDHAELLLQVEAMLQAYAKAADFLESPADAARLTSLFSPDQRHAALSAGDAQPGQHIGRYQLLQRLGEGGMGVVWLAEQTEPVQRQVAIKLIRFGMDSAAILARFDAERQALALMEHPNIARILDGGTTADQRPFFVMELVKGIPITKYCDEHRLTPRERLELFLPVCNAVHHAHQKGIIHRDLKPSNILIAPYDGKPVPKIIDFGVAKAMGTRLTEKTYFTEVGSIVGTLEYMSPEQAELNNLDIDTRSDIYALGVLLYELLTGSTPLDRRQFREVAFSELLRMIREVEPPKPSTKLSSAEALPTISAQRKMEPKLLSKLLQGDLDWIVMKALEKDRNRRYESASSFAQDLQRHLECQPVLAGPPSALYRLRKFVRRHRGPVATALLLLLVLIGGVIGTSWGFVTARAQRDHATSAQQTAEHLQAEAELLRDRALRGETLAKERLAQVTTQKGQLELAERHAAQERDVARAISLFLQNDLLGQAAADEQATPDVRPDRDVKVRTLLDRAAVKIQGRFEQQPRVEAALRRSLGMTYQQLGEYPSAEAQFLRLRRLVANAPDAYARYDAERALGKLYALQGRLKEADKLLAKAWQAACADLGEDHADSLLFGQDWTYILLHLGRYAEAEKLMRDLHERRLRVSGPIHSDTLNLENNLAILYFNQNRFDEAEKILTNYLEKLKRVRGAEHPHFLIGRMNLGVTLGKLGRMPAAEAMLRETRASQERILGPDHPDALSTGACLAGLYMTVGRYQDAITLGQPLLLRQERVLGQQHHEVLNALNNLGVAKQRLGRAQEAAEDFKRCLAGRRLVLTLEHPVTVQTEINLAMSYLSLKKYPAMVPLLDHAVSVKRKQLPPHHPDLQDLIAMQAFVAHQLQSWAMEEKLLNELLAIPASEARSGTIRGRQQVWLGIAIHRQQRSPEAIPLLEKGLEVLLKMRSWPPEYREAAQEGTAALADILRQRQQETDAKRWEERLRRKLDNLAKPGSQLEPAPPKPPHAASSKPASL